MWTSVVSSYCIMKDSNAGSTGCICLICSGVSILKSAEWVSIVIVWGSSEKLII